MLTYKFASFHQFHIDSGTSIMPSSAKGNAVLHMKTYLIIPHNRDAVANEIKSCALDHELDEFNTGNAKADRSCLGLYLCYSIQAMPWKSAALLEDTLQKSQTNTESFIHHSFGLHS